LSLVEERVCCPAEVDVGREPPLVLGQDPGQLQDDQPEVQVTKPLFFVTDEEAKQDKAFVLARLSSLV